MERENDKIERIINLLRKAEPVLDSTEEIEEKVIKRISEKKSPEVYLNSALDFLFSWISIGWVRRSMVTVSVILLVFFVWQQVSLMKQINYLNSRVISSELEYGSDEPDMIQKKLMMYKLSGKRIPVQNVTVSKKQMDLLLESVNDLEGKYRDLLFLIQDDPELSRYIENKIIERNKTKDKI